MARRREPKVPASRTPPRPGHRFEHSSRVHLERAARRLSRREELALEFVDMAGVLGFHGVGIHELCIRTGVSHRAYYQDFTSKEECFVLGIELRAGPLLDDAQIAFTRTEGPWEERLAAGLTSIMEDLARDPSYARSCCVEAFSAGEEALQRLREVIIRALRIFASIEGGHPVPSLTLDPLGSMAVGAILQPMQTLLRADRADLLPELVPRSVAFLSSNRTQVA